MIDLREEFTIKGKWWRPRVPDSELTGLLKFKPSQQSLTLHLNGSWDSSASDLEALKLLHGIVKDGRDVTLFHCREVCSDSGGAGSFTTFDVNTAYWGILLAPEESLVWNEAHIGMLHLDEIARIKQLPKSVTIDGIDYIKSWDLETVPLFVMDNESYSLSLLLTRTNSRQYGMARIWEELVISIQTFDEQELHFFRGIAQRIQNFITLFGYSPSLLTSITLYNSDYRYVTGELSKMKPVDVIFTQGWICALEKHFGDNSESRVWIPFSFRNDMSTLAECIQNWFNVLNRYSRACLLYFSLTYNPHMYAENEFLTLAYSIEAICRQKYTEGDLPENEHSNRIKVILDSIPTEYKNWLKGQLNYSNELTFRKRLSLLISDLSRYKFLKEVLCDEKKFIHDVVETRNYFVHPKENGKLKPPAGESFFILSCRLRIVIELTLLSDLMLPEQEMLKHFQRHYIYLFHNIV